MNIIFINFTFRGISRLKCHSVKQAEPITPLLLYINAFQESSILVLISFCLFLLARKSNLVPTFFKDLSNHKCVLRSDVSHFNDNLIVTLNWTKTIQVGERMLQTPLLGLPGSCLCPVSAYNNMLKVMPGTSSDAFFILPNGKSITNFMYHNKLRLILNNLEQSWNGFI
jgi:hypothetical protein